VADFIMDNNRDPDIARFAAALRAQGEERMRSQPSENRLVSTRRQHAAPERPDNPSRNTSAIKRPKRGTRSAA
jgi:hypothetical protein